jgi:hypothetical protein
VQSPDKLNFTAEVVAEALTVDRRHHTLDSRQQTADNRQQTTDNRQQTLDREKIGERKSGENGQQAAAEADLSGSRAGEKSRDSKSRLQHLANGAALIPHMN